MTINGTSQNSRNLPNKCRVPIPQRNGPMPMLDQLVTITPWHNKRDFGQVQSHSKHSVKECVSFQTRLYPKSCTETPQSTASFHTTKIHANPQISVDAKLLSQQRTLKHVIKKKKTCTGLECLELSGDRMALPKYETEIESLLTNHKDPTRSCLCLILKNKASVASRVSPYYHYHYHYHYYYYD